MSAQFIIEWWGAPIQIRAGTAGIVQEWEADRYLSEADAWLVAHRHRLELPTGVKVVNLYERDQKRSAVDSRPQPQLK